MTHHTRGDDQNSIHSVTIEGKKADGLIPKNRLCKNHHSMAFQIPSDTPPHELLKSKLFSYGIGGKTLKWINAFLCYRQQRVVVNGVKSDWAPVVSGNPQGTVLGPLLFSLHINDITADIKSEIRLFADDCVCYREIKDKEDTLKLQRDIDRLGNWARKWGMRFQPVKFMQHDAADKKTFEKNSGFLYLRRCSSRKCG